MQTPSPADESKPSTETIQTEEEHRSEKRRQDAAEGYVIIPEVGWVCRRLQTRRDEDNKLE